MTVPRDKVFILGTQRSGTTWIANIFDSHPDCLHFYEPFAPAYGLFPYLPHEFEWVEPPALWLRERLRADFPRLIDKRSRLFDPVRATRSQFMLEAALMRFIARIAHKSHTKRHFRFADQFNLIHLNRLGQDPPAWFAKNPEPSHMAVKEVRAYFKVLLLADAFPRARFIHVMRHPAAVVNSMQRYLERGKLVEIRAHISGFADAIAAQDRFRGYTDLLDVVRHGGRNDQLAAYWRIANESLVEQFAMLDPARVRALVYEELATDPIERTRELLAWCGLEMPATVEDYVRGSSTSRSDRRTELDTNRVSATYYKDWVGRTPAGVLAAVERVCADSPLMRRFEPFYDAD